MRKGRIIINPKIQGGKPVIKGTRVPVEVVVGALAGGMTTKEICQEYRIKEEDIKACLKYATEILTEEKVFAFSR